MFLLTRIWIWDRWQTGYINHILHPHASKHAWSETETRFPTSPHLHSFFKQLLLVQALRRLAVHFGLDRMTGEEKDGNCFVHSANWPPLWGMPLTLIVFISKSDNGSATDKLCKETWMKWRRCWCPQAGRRAMPCAPQALRKSPTWE